MNHRHRLQIANRQNYNLCNLIDFLCFPIYSEDILNYEIGDVDADDTDLTGADEDELLLSDDGKIAIQIY